MLVRETILKDFEQIATTLENRYRGLHMTHALVALNILVPGTASNSATVSSYESV